MSPTLHPVSSIGPVLSRQPERQPFGELRLSGIGSKAGGPDYVLRFMQPKTFSEYTVRWGFAPPPD